MLLQSAHVTKHLPLLNITSIISCYSTNMMNGGELIWKGKVKSQGQKNRIKVKSHGQKNRNRVHGRSSVIFGTKLLIEYVKNET